jgi:hypothetical protein
MKWYNYRMNQRRKALMDGTPDYTEMLAESQVAFYGLI